MTVTFKVSKTIPTVFNLKRIEKHDFFNDEKSQSVSKLSSNHYLNNCVEYDKEKCTSVLQETNWDPLKTQSLNNGFVNTVVAAYNSHHNLVLRPDDVWIAIVTQFSSFVNKNSEQLREMFVSHKDKKELVVEQAALNKESADYAKLSKDMVNLLNQHVNDSELTKWILPNFSTTTHNDTIVGSVVFMASMKKYFNMKFLLKCGIPQVTLLGTVTDWELLRSKIDFLRKYGLVCQKWADMLVKVADNFVKSAKNDPDIEWWQRVCSNHGNGSGPRWLSGWITVFCVFNEKGNWQGDKFTVDSSIKSEYPVINTNNIPAGYVTVPVEIDDNGTTYQSLMFAGHMLTEKITDYTISPKLTWAIVLKE